MGLLNLTLSSAVYMPFMSVVLRREALDSIVSYLVLTHSCHSERKVRVKAGRAVEVGEI
jgi:hypothetical protein